MDVDGAYDSQSIVSSDEEEKDLEMDRKTIGDQSKIFEEMKVLLTTQQENLKQNLQVLQSNATKVKKVNQVTSTSDCSSPHKQQQHGDHANDHLQTRKNEITHEPRKKDNSEDTDSSRQWSHSSGRSRDDIQICPICGAEFDDPGNPEALEIHVAGHWSEPN